ncbi:unnamed protein product [Urochloa humidicola]
MSALAPLGGARPRRRSATRDGAALERCITLGKDHPLSHATSNKRKRKTSTPEEPVPELSDEIVHDILVRLPAKSILQCKAVCKAWRAIISDPLFTQAHLQCSASRCEQNPCLIVTPHTLDRVILSSDVRTGQLLSPITSASTSGSKVLPWLA